MNEVIWSSGINGNHMEVKFEPLFGKKKKNLTLLFLIFTFVFVFIFVIGLSLTPHILCPSRLCGDHTHTPVPTALG